MGLEHSDLLKSSTATELPEKVHGAQLEEATEWFTNSPEFRAWVDEAGFALLWLHAPPGFGKSVLMSYMLKQLPHYIESTKDWDTAAIFHCYQAVSENSLLASLVFQLVRDGPRAQIVWQGAASQIAPSAEWELTNRLRILLKCAIERANARETVIFIDGVDELKSKMRKSFLNHLLLLGTQTKPSTALRILISSRNYPDIAEHLADYPIIEPGKERKGDMPCVPIKCKTANRRLQNSSKRSISKNGMQ